MSTAEPLKGTGDGDGFTPGKKIKAFLWLVIAVNFTIAVASKVHTPETVATNALWIIGFAGLVTIGGQSLVDTVAKWAETKKP